MKIEDLEVQSQKLVNAYVKWLTQLEVTGERVIEVLQTHQVMTLNLIKSLVPDERFDELLEMYTGSLQDIKLADLEDDDA